MEPSLGSKMEFSSDEVMAGLLGLLPEKIGILRIP